MDDPMREKHGATRCDWQRPDVLEATWRRADRRRHRVGIGVLLKHASLFSQLSYVCPEPVLVK